jgi:hypothetical protein
LKNAPAPMNHAAEKVYAVNVFLTIELTTNSRLVIFLFPKK